MKATRASMMVLVAFAATSMGAAAAPMDLHEAGHGLGGPGDDGHQLTPEVRVLPPEIACRTTVVEPAATENDILGAPYVSTDCNEMGCDEAGNCLTGECGNPEYICMYWPSVACYVNADRAYDCRCLII